MKKNLSSLLMISLGLAIMTGCTQPNSPSSSTSAADPWTIADSIRNAIVAPQFRDAVYNIMDYDASTDSTIKSTAAINNAISTCHDEGGGKVVIPSGTYLTGAIHLKSNVNLHFEDGAKLLFSRDIDDYKPLVKTRWEGMECMNYSPLIYAYEVENIAITGNGILDGNADNEYWWPWKAKKEYGWVEGMPN
ncbi:MAG TPA: glycosyl hydrolase family 28-related protein, partial [Sphingobacterium sp.]|nr:glycosyl hydrolase family 28-related protein [Sphingobacterium sp.]